MNNETLATIARENTSLALSTLAIAAAGAAVVFASTAISRKPDNSQNDKPIPLPVAPIGSKFAILPKSGVTLRYTDTQEEQVTEKDSGESSSEQVTFVLLHGFAGCVETWELLTPYLVKSNSTTNESEVAVRVVAIDMVGSGFSDKPIGDDFDYAYRNQGKVVSEFISVLSLSNVVIVGHSSGTVVGAATASQQQSNGKTAVVGAVFMACALFRPKSDFFSKSWLKPLFRWMTKKMMANRKQSLERMHLPAHAERVLTDDFVEKFAAPTRLPNFHDALVETVMAKEAPYEELVDELINTPSAPFPMLFVWGKQDTYTPLPAEQKDSIQQKLDTMNKTSEQERQPIVETTELDECHHYPQHEQPEALANEILTFVQKNVKLH